MGGPDMGGGGCGDRRRPTLAELRAGVFKPGHERSGSFLARRWARPWAVYGTWLGVRLGVSPHAATSAALGVALLSGLALGWGPRWAGSAGVGLLFLGFWLDRVDGQLARWTGRASLDGVYFDYVYHHVWALATGLGAGHGMAVRTGEPIWALAGGLAGGGWLLIGALEDARYKAMFTRLKLDPSARRTRSSPPERVGGGVGVGEGWAGGSIGGWARWALAKGQEPHAVMSTLAVPGLAWLFPGGARFGDAALGCALAFWAAGAPLVALGRAGRTIRSGKVERDFAGWFEDAGSEPAGAGEGARDGGG